ncbi:hypothetical protein B0H15DRAFT_949488 [Mycena belliarum]|uniref:Uncharacterized protein n=1 Tax=Mycena belliarum TaxID=1033014 RepID=A0AAD6XR32_9AGAR|nr:hypothetical protein B0H15DRAFT_949488 [Mycena belliae]
MRPRTPSATYTASPVRLDTVVAASKSVSLLCEGLGSRGRSPLCAASSFPADAGAWRARTRRAGSACPACTVTARPVPAEHPPLPLCLCKLSPHPHAPACLRRAVSPRARLSDRTSERLQRLRKRGVVQRDEACRVVHDARVARVVLGWTRHLGETRILPCGDAVQRGTRRRSGSGTSERLQRESTRAPWLGRARRVPAPSSHTVPARYVGPAAERLELLAHLLNATAMPGHAALVQTYLRVMLVLYILHSWHPGAQAVVDDAWATPVL